ncbi:hypothetical protein [Catellatospora paridis]|uniref:hypothetical protein n=1 Tax=Catellatospora paridis TaxID=1617086 RepID=UPI0012D4AA61|nr:hypothetical protein [Catellatospora paridis]
MQFSDLFAAVVRRDVTAVEAALNDPVVGDRALAAAIHLPVSDEALTTLIRTAPEMTRRRCYGVLRRSRRRALADSLLPEVVATFGEREGIILLAACSSSIVDSWLPRLAVTEAGLRSLVDVAPVAVANIISDRRWGYHLQRLVVRDSPAAALRLIELSGHADQRFSSRRCANPGRSSNLCVVGIADSGSTADRCRGQCCGRCANSRSPSLPHWPTPSSTPTDIGRTTATPTLVRSIPCCRCCRPLSGRDWWQPKTVTSRPRGWPRSPRPIGRRASCHFRRPRLG